ncbi:MAG: malate dehydrogenase [Gammaproteobacteria bacterium]|nr:malate dehydrogenase [Gammaproteobacteria bacterium]
MSTLSFSEEALKYHREPTPGKLATAITKPTESQYDLSLAYTPGVAQPVTAIAQDPEKAYDYTGKGNLVAVITNGTAVLGLGDVGALASKPVMEGKGVLFKRFANIDVFDIEIDCADPYDLVETIVRISPTFGGINLEDIKAPECFIVESELKKRLNIPVFHDDQHGTAIIVAAGLINALVLQQKKLADVKIVCLGAGAAGIASMNLLLHLGAQANNIYMVDRNGIIHSERNDLNEYKQPFALNTEKRTLADAMQDADVFIGVSGANLVTAEMIAAMAEKPIIFALSNPDPEISPEVAHSVRQDLIMATGRSDYPNQVNNVLGFPYIFRGALDVRAHTINIEMQIAAVHAISELAYEEVPAEVLAAYPQQTHLAFGPDYILPKPMDSRLKTRVSAAVAKAAIESGVTS